MKCFGEAKTIAMHSMYTIERTTSDNPDFRELSTALEDELKLRDGDESSFYAALNKTDRMPCTIVVYKNGLPAGCGAIRIYDEDRMEIKRMFVKPANRRQGIATTILNELEKWSAELGAKFCILETGKNQPEAIGLYERNQYGNIPNFGRYMGSENSICFEKRVCL